MIWLVYSKEIGRVPMQLVFKYVSIEAHKFVPKISIDANCLNSQLTVGLNRSIKKKKKTQIVSIFVLLIVNFVGINS